MNSFSVLQLVKKDFRVFALSIIGWSGFALINGMFLLVNEEEDSAALMAIMSLLIALASIMPFVPERQNNNAWMHLGSLPVKRTSLFVARYLSSFCIILFNLVLWFLAYTLLEKVMGKEPQAIFTPKLILIVWYNALIVWAIFYFAFFRYNLLVTIILFAVALLLPALLRVAFTGLKDGFSPYFVPEEMGLFWAETALTASLFVLSFVVSLLHFQKKDI